MRMKYIQEYLDAYWASDIQMMDIVWEILYSNERYFIETRGLAPWQNS